MGRAIMELHSSEVLERMELIEGNFWHCFVSLCSPVELKQLNQKTKTLQIQFNGLETPKKQQMKNI